MLNGFTREVRRKHLFRCIPGCCECVCVCFFLDPFPVGIYYTCSVVHPILYSAHFCLLASLPYSWWSKKECVNLFRWNAVWQMDGSGRQKRWFRFVAGTYYLPPCLFTENNSISVELDVFPSSSQIYKEFVRLCQFK